MLSVLRRRCVVSRRMGDSPAIRQYACEALESRTLLSLTVPPLSSLPGAAQTLYLDFDGSPAFLWDGANSGEPYTVRGPGSSPLFPTPVPAFTTDGDANNFSDPEIANIKNIFEWVKEKFSPFSINVTTINPGPQADSQGMTCMIGGSSDDWLGMAAGGVADLDGFVDGGENICFAFSAGLALDTVEHFLGETIAHEAGHEVGLEHQRKLVSGTPQLPFEIDEYYDGDSIRAPIMGGSANNYSARGIWWVTNNWSGQNSPDAQQDDLISLTADAPQRLFFRNDDYNVDSPNMVFSTSGALTPLKGIIERNGDIDGFRFNATGTRATFEITNAQFGGMLAPTATIRISSTSTLIPVNVTLTKTSATIEATGLTPGTNYVLQVSGRGQYGDLGQYNITGSIQQFATFNPASGQVNVGGFIGNNNVTLKTNGNILIVEDSVNGGPVSSQSFTLSSVSTVIVTLGNGNDTLNVAMLTRGDHSSVSVVSNLGGGNDILRLGATGNSFTTFNVNKFAITWTTGNTFQSYVSDSQTERIELIGTQDLDVFNIRSTGDVSAIFVYGNDQSDRMVVEPGVLRTFAPELTFMGGPGADTLELSAATINEDQQWYVFGDYVSHGVPNTITGLSFVSFDAAVELVSLTTGRGNDFIRVYEALAGKTIAVNSNDGADVFEVGESSAFIPGVSPIYPFSQSVRGTINLTGGNGLDKLEIDDAAYTGAATYVLDAFRMRNTFYADGRIDYDSTVDRIDLRGRGGETTTLFAALVTQEFHLFNGTGNGAGALIIDNRTGGSSTIEIQPGTIVRKSIFGSVSNVYYDGYEGLTVYANDSAHAINVYGTSPNITSQTTIVAGTGNDVVTLFPHGVDGLSAATIVTALGYFGGGGSDTFRIDESASTSPIDYVINNAGGSTTANIFGFGPSGVGAFNDVETVSILAGSANDTFAVNSYKNGSALAISGGGGDDTVNAGAGNIAVNLASISAFSFDGQDGVDLLHYDHSLATNNASYRRDIGTSGVFVNSTYFLGISDSNVEAVSMTGSAVLDQLVISAVAAGTSLRFTGNAGRDELFFSPANGMTDGVRGPVIFDTGADAGRVSLSDSGDTSGKTFHLDATSLGAYAGDTLFGPGGSLQFTTLTGIASGVANFAAMVISLGSGSDTVYAQPLATGQVRLSAGGPTDTPGDTLNLALATVENYAITPDDATSGTLTSTSHVKLTYSAFENGPNVDDTTPVADIVDVSPDPRETPVDFVGIVFSEQIIGLDVADLSLTRDGGSNLLTGGESLVTADNITWTLGDLTSLTGIAGTYTLALTAFSAGVTDVSSNALVVDANASWIVTPPTWLAAGSEAVWDPSTNTLTIAGPTTIVAEPPASAIVTADGPTAVLTIDLGADPTIHFGALSLSNGASAILTANGAADGVLVVEGTLSITEGSSFDLTDNALIAKSATIADINALILIGYNNGDWMGGGITSSSAANDPTFLTTVGFASNAELVATEFEGETGLDEDDVLIRYTYYGDADLTGSVDLDDFNLFLAGYQDAANVAQTWIYGDFDFSGSVDLDDFNLFLAAYQAQGDAL